MSSVRSRENLLFDNNLSADDKNKSSQKFINLENTSLESASPVFYVTDSSSSSTLEEESGEYLSEASTQYSEPSRSYYTTDSWYEIETPLTTTERNSIRDRFETETQPTPITTDSETVSVRNWFIPLETPSEDDSTQSVSTTEISPIPPLTTSTPIKDSIENPPCLLGHAQGELSSWIYENGSLINNKIIFKGLFGRSLDLSNRLSSENRIYHDLRVLLANTSSDGDNVIAFSAAFNHLKTVPRYALQLIDASLTFLSLRGNNFTINYEWWLFPTMLNLRHLDLFNCNIETLDISSFKELPNLEYLYMAHNKLAQIPSKTFSTMPHLRYLDLSYMDYSNEMQLDSVDPKAEPYLKVFEGIALETDTFANLHSLVHLDFSYSRMTPISALSFAYLQPNLEYLSLCYTGLAVMPTGMFSNTSLKVLDLSGTTAAMQLTSDSFKGIEDTLEYFSAEKSNIKSLDWLRNLTKLKFLKLKSNNINTLSNETLAHLHELQILDLSNNHIGNWYSRAFVNNRNLKILNLNGNNINMLTSQMYSDFSELKYLGLGENDFVCNCVLRDLIEIAIANDQSRNCPGNNKKDTQNSFEGKEILRSILNGYMLTVKESSENVNKIRKNSRLKLVVHRASKNLASTVLAADNEDCLDEFLQKPKFIYPTVLTNPESLSFNFQLLDYVEEKYWCFNSTTNIGQTLASLDECYGRQANQSAVAEIESVTKYVFISLTMLTIMFIATFVLYYKWWYIRYFFILMKNNTILSFLDKEKDFINQNDNNLPYIYDIFVSYCDENREWVLQELLPNLEQGRDVTLCLHERDFQVGLSILENIIFCMDRSRYLMLIVSKSFLQSHWCQFEMHLAQHRLLETRKEHLLLVFLEDIPRNRRPKTLHYLMQIKTYIKWPTSSNSRKAAEERKFFWYRLRKSLQNVEWDND